MKQEQKKQLQKLKLRNKLEPQGSALGMKKQYSFGKSEHLCSRDDIKDVVENGKKAFAFPFAASYVVKDATVGNTHKIAISVGKRLFKKAVDRNLLKRRIRESYRQNKHCLLDVALKYDVILNILIVYVSKEKLQYKQIEQGICLLLKSLSKSIEKNCNLPSDSVD